MCGGLAARLLRGVMRGRDRAGLLWVRGSSRTAAANPSRGLYPLILDG